MGWGKIYEVDDSARALFAGRKLKSEWYEALGMLQLDDSRYLDTEDSIRNWGTVLRDQAYPLGRLFVGEMHSEYDDFDDPNALFLGRDIVADISHTLVSKGRDFFIKLFKDEEPLAEKVLWLYEPMMEFFRAAFTDSKALIILWER